MLLALLGMGLLALGGALVTLGAVRPHGGPPFLARLFAEADAGGEVQVDARPVDGPRASPDAARPARFRLRTPEGATHRIARFRLLADGRAVGDVAPSPGAPAPPPAAAAPGAPPPPGGPASLVLGRRDRAGTIRLELVAASFVEAPDAEGAPLVTLELAEAAAWVEAPAG